ncbi:YeeE/YedE thiosulfate transporter family protein [Hydrogenovibrio kuenenii]|uniref:YeeE/YedE thiosulfate transporter family protein n=1 Tax=Hydrogenovibrio kuenenii TaxID=63658 RepID=UPI000463BA9D|nr:YeeE/YedE thiosulfate transporter family protein [Hydrogenovibrio kuenenii]
MIQKGEYTWLKGGLALALVAAIATILVKPIGVSTQFVVTDTIIWKTLDSNVVQVTEKDGKKVYSSPNDYINKARASYAHSASNPINYSYVFVLSMMLGAMLSSMFGGPKASAEEKQVPEAFRRRYGFNPKKRYFFAFLGGIFTLFGARLAGGCTSGHMISGMLQTAVSGYVFAFGVFLVAIPTALLVYGIKRKQA